MYMKQTRKTRWLSRAKQGESTRETAEIAADRSEHARQIAGPALQPCADLLFQCGRIDGMPIEPILRSLSYPRNVAQSGRKRMRALPDITGDEFVGTPEFIL